MTGGDGFEEVVDAVRERVDPGPRERERLRDAVAELRARAERAIDDLPVDADVVHVGSTARETWVSGARDVDLFVRFPPDLPREDLAAYGLAVGNAVLPTGREEYAEHPYVKGEYDGVTVDLVPCYRVASATDIQSAVDRTPFHNAYLQERLDDETAAAVRVFKQFLDGAGVYGSDLRTRGFSGYLTELLVLECGGLREVLEAAADWHPPVRIDPEDHGTATFDHPLVVVDPTDPERNVAAVVSESNVARLQHHARTFLANPAEEAFFPDPPDPVSPADVRRHLDRRGTAALAVRFDPPDLVDDQLYPQLRKSLRGVVTGLETAGFDALRSEAFADETAVLFVELATATLPSVERHVGPPVHVREHAADFFEKYAGSDVYGPFIEDGRYVVERERTVTTVREFAENRLLEVSLGRNLERALADGYDVLAGDEVATLADEFGVELARYFAPEP